MRNGVLFILVLMIAGLGLMSQLANDKERHPRQETIVFEDDEVPSYLVVKSGLGQAVVIVEAQRSSR